jgi:hypothetical protein
MGLCVSASALASSRSTRAVAAELRRGDRESADVALHLVPIDPRGRFEWVGDLLGHLATIRPDAVIVLGTAAEPIGRAAFPPP